MLVAELKRDRESSLLTAQTPPNLGFVFIILFTSSEPRIQRGPQVLDQILVKIPGRPGKLHLDGIDIASLGVGAYGILRAPFGPPYLRPRNRAWPK